MTHSVNFLVHLQAIKECLPRFEARATCNIDTGELQIRARGRSVEMHPQYGVRYDNSTGYSQQLVPDVEFFVGWRPYTGRVWPLSFDKRAFKEFCGQKGLATPRSWLNAQTVSGNVLLKQANSSFARGISGPFTPQTVKARNSPLQNGEFFEEFIQGDIVKVWYWNATPVVLDVRPMPTVTGNGIKTVRTLIQCRRSALVPQSNWDIWEEVVAFQGVTLDSVLPNGRKLLVDFRWPSPLHPPSPENPGMNVLSAYEGTPLLRQLRDVGGVFWEAIPAEIRQDTLYSIDAILDPRQELFFLEMNCNSFAHPDCYFPMFRSLFGAPAALPAPPAEPRLKMAATA